MTDDGIGEAIDRLAAVNDLMLEMNAMECLDHTYQTFLDDISETQWGDDVSFVWRPWLWQTCTEFGWYQTTNQVISMKIIYVIVFDIQQFNFFVERTMVWFFIATRVL